METGNRFFWFPTWKWAFPISICLVRDSMAGQNYSPRFHTESPHMETGRQTKKFPFGDSPFQNRVCSHLGINICSSIIYVADSYMTTDQCKEVFLKWVTIQPDIYILDGNENNYHFQFVFNEEMHWFFDPLPTKNKLKATVSNQTKTNLRKAFGSYTKDNTHCISVISTLPTLQCKRYSCWKHKLDYAVVISTLSLMFGNSPEYGFKRQLISSPCCPRSEPYGYEEDQGNKK